MTNPYLITAPALDPRAEELCRVCESGGWVCENHLDRPWAGTSVRDDACDCGAGAPCGACRLEMAAAGYVHQERAAILAWLRNDVGAELTRMTLMAGMPGGTAYHRAKQRQSLEGMWHAVKAIRDAIASGAHLSTKESLPSSSRSAGQ